MLSAFAWSTLDPQVKATIATIIVSFVGYIGKRIVTPRSRVAWGVPHQFFFRLPNGPNQETAIRTREVWVQNVGSATATNIAICLNHPCQHLEVWPPGEQQLVTTNDGRWLIKIPRMVKREYVRIMLFEARANDIELPEVLSVKWDDGEAKSVLMGPSQVFSPWVLRGLRTVLMIGFIALAYLVLLGIVLLTS